MLQSLLRMPPPVPRHCWPAVHAPLRPHSTYASVAWGRAYGNAYGHARCRSSADRQVKGKITRDGVFLEALEANPSRFLPDVQVCAPQ